MANVKLTEDLLVPHPSGREGTWRLVGRKGAYVDERVVAAANEGRYEDPSPAVVRNRPAPKQAAEAAESGGDAVDYGAMKKDELAKLAASRGLDVDGLKKDELVEALEDADAKG